MAPLRGQYLEYYIGIGKDIVSGLSVGDFNKLKNEEKWERALIKEPIGNFLDLQLAPPRRGQFADTGNNTNAERYFAYRKQKGSRAFKFGLVPGTEIDVAYQERTANGIQIVEKKVTVAEFQISLPRTCSVTEVIEWIQKGTKVGDDGQREDTAAGSHTNSGAGGSTRSPFDLITYIITPAGRKHALRGIIDNKFVPESPGTATDPGDGPVNNSGGSDGNSGGNNN